MQRLKRHEEEAGTVIRGQRQDWDSYVKWLEANHRNVDQTGSQSGISEGAASAD